MTYANELSKEILVGLKNTNYMMRQEIIKKYGKACSAPIVSRALKILIDAGEIEKIIFLHDVRQRAFRVIEQDEKEYAEGLAVKVE